LSFTTLKFSAYRNFSEVTFYDFQSGESTLIKSAFDECIALIDTGSKVNKKALPDSLHSEGITKINYIFITHSDEDHLGIINDLNADFKVEKIIVGKYDDYNYNGNNVEYVTTRKNYTCGNLNIDVNFEDIEHHDKNDNSLIIYTKLGFFNFLFLGDASTNLDNYIIKQNYKVDVLKVAHHGSRTGTSKELLNALKPKIAIIMTGRNSQYNFPHQEIVDRIEELNIILYRTDKDYSIRYRYNNKKYSFIKCKDG
jgi:competence protein ComEC